MTTRTAKILLPLMLAAFAFSAALNNIVDYGSNFLFVQHVLSMDTTFPGNALMNRAIPHPIAWHVGYGIIIAIESLACLLWLGGAIALWRARKKDSARFNEAKRLVIAGCVTGFMLWFFGFMVIGGEWFLMWQSKTWNGQNAAFMFYMAVLGVLVFVAQPEADLRAMTQS